MRPLLGFSPPQSAVVFALSTPQAAATLAATIVGFNIGLFGESVVNAVLVLILVSIVLATTVMERAKGLVPRPAHTAPRLGDCILIALQEPEQALAAMTIAARIADSDGGVVHSVLASGAPEATRQQPRLTELREAALIVGVDTDPHLLVHGGLADAVVHASIETEASLVIAGESTSGGPSAFGTWGESVASSAPAPAVILRGRMEHIDEVHLIRSDPEREPRRIGHAARRRARAAHRRLRASRCASGATPMPSAS